MKSLSQGITLLCCILLSSNLLQAQMRKGELKKAKTVSSEISANQKHHYTVSLDANQFAFFKLMQQGVDIRVSTYDPTGKKLEDFDSPNGRTGPELFSITSKSKGRYTIEVSPFDDNEPNGTYELSAQSIKPKATTPNELVDELFTPWDSDDTPGASVAVVRDGAIVYKKGYGMANLEYDIPNTPSTVFHIASVSKQFTAFSILLLEKEGKLSLDDDIRKYIPEVPDFGKTITLRHLATHTSGMRDQWNLLSMAGWRMDDVITKGHVLKLVSKQKELNFNPGDEYLYCNTGFTLLAEVVARVSDQSFAEFTKAKIFEPLQMNNTLFYDDHEKIVKNRAYSYYDGHNGFKKSVLSYANVGATSLFTTVEDLSLWSLNFASPKVGDQAIIEKLNTLAVLNNGKTFGGALGQFVGKYKGLNEIQHGGADAGYRTYLTRFPDEKFSVVVFSNSAQFNAGGMAHKVVDIYLKDKIKEAPKKKEEPKEENPTEKIEVTPQTIATYVGKYELQPGFVISIQEREGALEAQATGQPTVKLEAMSLTKFQVVGVPAVLEFVPNNGKPVQVLKLLQGGQATDAKRVKDFDEKAVKLSDFTGEFYSEELATSYHFQVEADKLVAKHNRLSDITLNPSKKDVFSGSTWYFGQITFVRDTEGQVTGCKVSNGRVRNLHFEKIN